MSGRVAALAAARHVPDVTNTEDAEKESVMRLVAPVMHRGRQRALHSAMR